MLNTLPPSPEEYRSATQFLLVIVLALLIGWDLFVYHVAGVQATISRVLYDAAKGYPGLAVAFGGLLGHLFYSQRVN